MAEFMESGQKPAKRTLPPIVDLLARARHSRRVGRVVADVARLGRQFALVTDGELVERTKSLRYRARSGVAVENLLAETFALVRESARRNLGLAHYDEQLAGAAALVDGAIVEMETGEGKTLTATLPLVLRALVGRGALLATANDYLARRDAGWMGPVYRGLGLSVGVVEASTSRRARSEAYACDVTYGTAREFGFDFLRDLLAARHAQGALGLISRADRQWNRPIDPRLSLGLASAAVETDAPVQREPWFLLVDEADSLLIDEARTPLILSGPPPGDHQAVAAACIWAARAIGQFVEGAHFLFEDTRRSVLLTAAGRELVRRLTAPPEIDSLGMLSLYEHIERALLVAGNYRRDRQYIVRESQIVIIDESTGRPAENRRWQAGIHQAVEAQEGVPVRPEVLPLARITTQEFVLRFPHLAGMTGTALPAAREFRKVYSLRTVRIATHLPSRRSCLPDRVLATAEEKWQAILEHVAHINATGRPVLIGTRSIAVSELLSNRLAAAGINHQVLNARLLPEEAAIVARAGEQGRVTVATNMAGRGTDICLSPGIAELGGLCVIGTELHEAARIDWQLAGRTGRQGDPGTFQQYMALDDELLERALGARRALRIAAAWTARVRRDPESSATPVARLFRRAQRLLERRATRARVELLYAERQRQQMMVELGQDPHLDSPV